MKRIKILIAFIVIAVIVAITTLLISNKSKINAANQIIDRSHIPVTVTSLKIQLGTIEAKTILPAKLIPYEEAVISVQTPGIISVFNIEVGSKVLKGQVVGSVDTKTAQISLKTMLLSNTKFKEDYERAKDLFKGNATTEVNVITAKYNYENSVLQIEQLKQQIENASIVAPINGVITNCNLKAGEYVNPGNSIASVVNISKLKATAFVDQTEVYSIGIGQTVNIKSSAFPDKKWTGTVEFISPNGDENHNYQIDVLINNTPETLKAGTNVSVEFDMEKRENRIVIPKKALVADKQEPYVYIIKNGIAHGCNVVVGLTDGDTIEIVRGLSVGDELVLSGQINLREGAITKIVKQ